MRWNAGKIRDIFNSEVGWCVGFLWFLYFLIEKKHNIKTSNDRENHLNIWLLIMIPPVLWVMFSSRTCHHPSISPGKPWLSIINSWSQETWNSNDPGTSLYLAKKIHQHRNVDLFFFVSKIQPLVPPRKKHADKWNFGNSVFGGRFIPAPRPMKEIHGGWWENPTEMCFEIGEICGA